MDIHLFSITNKTIKNSFVYVIILLITYYVLSASCLSAPLSSNLNVELLNGNVKLNKTSFSNYGCRIEYTISDRISVGAESFFAYNWNKKLYMNSYNPFLRLTLYRLFWGKPYFLISSGLSRYELSEYDKNNPKLRPSYSFKAGISFNVNPLFINIETGYSKLLERYQESNISLGYSFQLQRKLNIISNCTSVAFGLQGFASFIGEYKGQRSYPGFDISIRSDSNYRYNFGMFFTSNVFSTGCFQIGTSKNILSYGVISKFLSLSPGIQLLLFAEPYPDFILPAGMIEIELFYEITKFTIFTRSRIIGTYSFSSGGLIGAVYSVGFGLGL